MEKAFERVLIVMFENQYRSYVAQHPFMRKLSATGAELTNSFGAFHPSQTNYLASLSGEVCGVTNDTPPVVPLQQKTLVDLLEDAGVSWKAYMEGYPGDPWNEAWKQQSYPPELQPITEYPGENSKDLARYFRKHNAFASYHSIQKNKERWAKIVDEQTFWLDMADRGKKLPAYSWFTPDIWNDGHYLYNTHVDTNPRTLLISQVAGWLEYVFLGKIQADHLQGITSLGQAQLGLQLDIDLLLTDPKTAWAQSQVPEGTLIVITFDEADFDATGFDTNYDGPNQIYTVLLGDMIEPGTVIDTPLNHYSLIKTVERNFGLGSLDKNDRDANWIRQLWGESFLWSDVEDSGLVAKGNLAVAQIDNRTCVVFDEGEGRLAAAVIENGKCSPAMPTGLKTIGKDGFVGPIALAALNGLLHLVFTGEEGLVWHASSDTGEAWSEPEELGIVTQGALAMTAYYDIQGNAGKLMLCFVDGSGFIHALGYDGRWAESATPVGQLTDGPMALSQLGPSLYLVYKERNTRKMRMTSYNLAPFNAFKALTFKNKADKVNDTSIHQWSPFDMQVGHFSKKMGALQNNYQALGNIALASIEGEMHLVNRGGYSDTPQGYTALFGLTGIFTATHQGSNGFGTIDQAGWTLEKELSDVSFNPESGIGMTSDGHQLTLVWQDADSNTMQYIIGAYSVSKI